MSDIKGIVDFKESTIFGGRKLYTIENEKSKSTAFYSKPGDIDSYLFTAYIKGDDLDHILVESPIFHGLVNSKLGTPIYGKAVYNEKVIICAFNYRNDWLPTGLVTVLDRDKPQFQVSVDNVNKKTNVVSRLVEYFDPANDVNKIICLGDYTNPLLSEKFLESEFVNFQPNKLPFDAYTTYEGKYKIVNHQFPEEINIFSRNLNKPIKFCYDEGGGRSYSVYNFDEKSTGTKDEKNSHVCIENKWIESVEFEDWNESLVATKDCFYRKDLNVTYSNPEDGLIFTLIKDRNMFITCEHITHRTEVSGVENIQGLSSSLYFAVIQDSMGYKCAGFFNVGYNTHFDENTCIKKLVSGIAIKDGKVFIVMKKYTDIPKQFYCWLYLCIKDSQ